MLRSLKELTGYTIQASDGDIGTAYDFYFDNHNWTIRYLVVDMESWLPGRRVLLSPLAFRQPHWEAKRFPVALTREQVKHSPDIDTNKPVSRQQETELYTYYDWSPYWETGTLFPLGTSGLYPPVEPLPLGPKEEEAELAARATQEPPGDPHLSSAQEVKDYHIQARDDDIGHVEDFLVDDETWTVQYMVVDTANWLPGKKVLVSPSYVKTINWSEKTVYVDLLRETIEKSPEYNPAVPIDQAYETRLYHYYHQPK